MRTIVKVQLLRTLVDQKGLRTREIIVKKNVRQGKISQNYQKDGIYLWTLPSDLRYTIEARILMTKIQVNSFWYFLIFLVWPKNSTNISTLNSQWCKSYKFGMNCFGSDQKWLFNYWILTCPKWFWTYRRTRHKIQVKSDFKLYKHIHF